MSDQILQASKGMGVAIKQQKCFAHLTMLCLTDFNEVKGKREKGKGKGPLSITRISFALIRLKIHIYLFRATHSLLCLPKDTKSPLKTSF